MKIKLKIYPKYLDQILEGVKKHEFREVESVILNDGTREVEFEVIDVWKPSSIFANQIKSRHPDVKWTGKPFIGIKLGKVLK